MDATVLLFGQFSPAHYKSVHFQCCRDGAPDHRDITVSASTLEQVLYRDYGTDLRDLWGLPIEAYQSVAQQTLGVDPMSVGYIVITEDMYNLPGDRPSDQFWHPNAKRLASIYPRLKVCAVVRKKPVWCHMISVNRATVMA